MKVNYKIEIHKRKGKKNDVMVILSWKNKKSNRYAERHIEYCCDEMKTAFDYGFITIERTQQHFRSIKYDEKNVKLKQPIVCLFSMNENGYGDDQCPHEEMSLPITYCPFCTKEIVTVCVERKRITHECKKVKHTYEECEDKITEEILSK